MLDGYDVLVKIIIVGDSGVGKSSLMNRHVDGYMSDKHITTIGVDFKSSKIKIGKKLVKMNIWDTAGQERFRSVIRGFYRNAHVALITFDLTSIESFENAKRWLDDVNANCDENVIKVFVGTKLDRQRKVNRDDVMKYISDMFDHSQIIHYFETSTFTGEGVNEMFIAIAEMADDEMCGVSFIDCTNDKRVGKTERHSNSCSSCY